MWSMNMMLIVVCQALNVVSPGVGFESDVCCCQTVRDIGFCNVRCEVPNFPNLDRGTIPQLIKTQCPDTIETFVT